MKINDKALKKYKTSKTKEKILGIYRVKAAKIFNRPLGVSKNSISAKTVAVLYEIYSEILFSGRFKSSLKEFNDLKLLKFLLTLLVYHY